MVRGPLRVVLWVLSSLAVLLLVLTLAMIPAMGRMMSGGMMEGGMMREGMTDGGMMGGCGMMGGGMMGMMGMMAIQGIVLLGLVGVFIYLVVDSFRSRRVKGSTL